MNSSSNALIEGLERGVAQMKKAIIWIIVVLVVLLLGFRIVHRVGQRRASALVEENKEVPQKLFDCMLQAKNKATPNKKH